uniref:KfrA N-terminal DNA-binding domain-containing protein n=1 Tax=uncultured prokaryote TaxID=198431 RepID=A0A0H5Q5R6_9ZZZZ|nr:hypothetical protein [uncultured prokaryote]
MALATKESVFAAADAIKVEGRNPTIDGVRKALGGGSYTPISDFLSQWRQATSQPAANPASSTPAPEALKTRLDELLGLAWAEALAQANARLDTERAALELTRTTLEAQKAEAAAFADAVDAELQEAKAEIRRLTDAAKTQAAQLAQISADLAQANTHLTQEQADHQAARAAKFELEKAMEATRAEHAKAQAEVARLTGELRATEAREAAQNGHADASEKRAAAAQEKAEKAAETLAQIRIELAEAKTQTKAAEQAAKHAQEEAATARVAEREANIRQTTLQLQLAALTKPEKPAAPEGAAGEEGAKA